MFECHVFLEMIFEMNVSCYCRCDKRKNPDCSNEMIAENSLNFRLLAINGDVSIRLKSSRNGLKQYENKN